MPIAIAVLTSCALCASVLGAQAQGMGASNARAQQQARDAKDKPPKADEEAYKNALKSVPTPQNTDPWGNMRSSPSSSR
jgi:AhpD family alkylhydroperoxidase